MPGTPPRFVIDISGHGWGHAAQVAPLVDALRARFPGCALTLRSQLDGDVLAKLIGLPFACAPPPPDPCLVMSGPLDVDGAASFAAHAALHADWDRAVAAEAHALEGLHADLLVSDVGYVGLAAAAAAGVPAVAVSSLNWADMFRTFCAPYPRSRDIHERMVDAYRSARLFLQVTPHMPMDDLPNRRSIGVLARRGRNRAEELRERLGLADGTRLVLVTLGGIPGGRSGTKLFRAPDIHWIVGENEGLPEPGRGDVTPLPALGLDFLDALASSDAVLTKTGYGTLTQAAAAGTRVLYVARPDWPESPWLEGWIRAAGTALPVDRETLAGRGLRGPLLRLLARPASAPIEPDGAGEAADALAEILGER